MFRQQGRGDEREPVTRPLPPDITPKLSTAPAAVPTSAPRRLPAHSRDERRLARIDRKVAERDQPAD
jgi:hypothetical protein